MKTGVISLSKKQLHRLDVLSKANAGFITVREAAERLGISERQVQRLKKEVREQGPAALIHKNTTRKPSHALSDDLKKKILSIRSKPGYRNANFKHFQELLAVHHDIHISYSALTRLLKAHGIISPKTKRRFKPHRRRKRRPQAGSLIQVDASPYDWLSTGTLFALHGAIDDATGQVTGLYLCRNECLHGYHEMMRRMLTVFGVPEALYADRHTIFRSPNADKAKAIDAPPGIKAHETQFGRALSELGIQIIAARSPQAKGRIERLWNTLQSRLPVELELRGIKDIEAANEFLRHYIFALNSEFAVEPSDRDTAFLPLEEGLDLNYILCVKEERTLDSGQVFSYHGQRFQIDPSPYSSYIPPKARMTVMASPAIGVMVRYLNYTFPTTPVSARTAAHSSPASEAKRERKKPAPAQPTTPGLLWQPGLPTHRDMLEIITEIFDRPYSHTKCDPVT